MNLINLLRFQNGIQLRVLPPPHLVLPEPPFHSRLCFSFSGSSSVHPQGLCSDVKGKAICFWPAPITYLNIQELIAPPSSFPEQRPESTVYSWWWWKSGRRRKRPLSCIKVYWLQNGYTIWLLDILLRYINRLIFEAVLTLIVFFSVPLCRESRFALSAERRPAWRLGKQVAVQWYCAHRKGESGVRVQRAFLLLKTFVLSESIFSNRHTHSLFLRSSCEGDFRLYNELNFYDYLSEQSRAIEPWESVDGGWLHVDTLHTENVGNRLSW